MQPGDKIIWEPAKLAGERRVRIQGVFVNETQARYRIRYWAGDAPIQDKHRFKMQRVAKMLDDIFNEGMKAPHKPVAWILLVTDYDATGKNARLNFISDGIERAGVVELFKEMIGRFEAANKYIAIGLGLPYQHGHCFGVGSNQVQLSTRRPESARQNPSPKTPPRPFDSRGSARPDPRLSGHAR